MDIYQVIIEDRHTDTEAIPFTTQDKAIAYAKEQYTAYMKGRDLYEDMGEQQPPDGSFYYAVYSTEGDCIWVIKEELDRMD